MFLHSPALHRLLATLRALVNQRRLPALKAYAIGRQALCELTTTFTRDTILRWHRELVPKKFDLSDKRKPGRPQISLLCLQRSGQCED